MSAALRRSHLTSPELTCSHAFLGVGIVGKEGKQASLAADFSVTQFSHLTKLLMWHGRNSYRRSAKLAQFVIHRGLIISVMQAVFSAIFYFAPIALYQGWLMIGYATIYTMAPVFSLVLDTDVNEDLALIYPELYKELTKVRAEFLFLSAWRRILTFGNLFLAGPSALLQDVLPMADDQCIPRSVYLQPASSHRPVLILFLKFLFALSRTQARPLCSCPSSSSRPNS